MKLDQCLVVLLNERLLGKFGHPIVPRLNSLSDSIHCLHFSPTAEPRYDLGCINKRFKMAMAEVLKGLLGMSHTHTQQIFCSARVSGAGALYYGHFGQFVLWSFRALHYGLRTCIWALGTFFLPLGPTKQSAALGRNPRKTELSLTSTLFYSL